MEDKFYVTEDGLQELKDEYENLVHVVRNEVIEDLKAARAQGDLSENADYDAARTRQAEIEGRIKEIENILANVKIINDKKATKVVTLGSTVTVKDLSDNTTATYTIVGTVEANPVKGLISNVSPLGKAIVDKAVGDKVVVHVAQEYQVEILKIESK